MTRTCRLPWLVLTLAVLAAPPAFADAYLVYTQGGIPENSEIYAWGSLGGSDFGSIDTCDTPEGGTFLRFRDPVYGGFGFFHLTTNRDLSAFENGELRFFLKTPTDLGGRADPAASITCGPKGSEVEQILDLDLDGTADPLTAYGWDASSDDWQEISIPICDFFGGTCDAASTQCLQQVESPLVINLRVAVTNRVSVWLDYARWETPNSHAGASSVTVNGRQLAVNGKPFSVNGMNYAPIAVGDNWQGAWRDRPDRYEVDFPKIAASGANTVRLYAPILSSNLLDEARAAGLYVIPTFGVDSIQLTCPTGKAFMQDRFVEMVEQWGDHPAVLFWLVGNEVNRNLGSADLCTDWYPQLDAMAAAAHAVEGASAHPVGTAVADVDDICTAGCSDDLTLTNVDLWGTQLYRGCTFGNAFNQYNDKANCDRPLVVTEFGVDAWKSMSNCSVSTGTSCYVNSDCPMGTCSADSAPCNIDTDCSQFPTAQTCDGGEFCDGAGMDDEAMQANCLSTLLSEADAELAIKTAGVSSGQVVFEWADEWWKAACLPTGGWPFHDTCANSTNFHYTMDPAINEEWFGVVANESFCSSTVTTPCTSDYDCPSGETCSTIPDPDARVNKSAHTRVGDAWLGAVCNMTVDSHVEGGETVISFDPAAGNAVDHTLYYGPLSAVSSYGYTGSRNVGATSPATITPPLPAGSLFWVVSAENGNALEGCYGTDSAGTERPCFSGNCSEDQIAGWNCLCSGQ